MVVDSNIEDKHLLGKVNSDPESAHKQYAVERIVPIFLTEVFVVVRNEIWVDVDQLYMSVLSYPE